MTWNLPLTFIIQCFFGYTFLMMLSVILLCMLMILLSILSQIRHLICWQLKLTSELESDRRDTVDCSRKWLNDFNAGKTQLVSLDRSDNTGGIDVKMDGSVLEEKSSLTMLGLTFSSKLNWGSYFVTIASKKIEALIRSMKFFLLRLLSIPINLPYAHEWNTVVTSRQVPLVTAWNC